MQHFLGNGLLINTPLQRGAQRPPGARNRFNGLPDPTETVETVLGREQSFGTPLKRGVNERAEETDP
jgi:hypothetical protein